MSTSDYIGLIVMLNCIVTVVTVLIYSGVADPRYPEEARWPARALTFMPWFTGFIMAAVAALWCVGWFVWNLKRLAGQVWRYAWGTP